MMDAEEIAKEVENVFGRGMVYPGSQRLRDLVAAAIRTAQREAWNEAIDAAREIAWREGGVSWAHARIAELRRDPIPDPTPDHHSYGDRKP
jgi:hypothetical protein